MIFLRPLQFGDAGVDVRWLQLMLKEIGYGDFMATGFFGSKTRDAVKKFQQDNAITPVAGYFGPKTRPIMLEKVSDKHRGLIFAVSKSCLGMDVTPEDIVPDEYDCADTVCTLLKKAGFTIGNFPLTTDLYHAFIYSSGWRSVTDPLPGDVIISPTGMGNGNLANGHVGIMAENGVVMSNNSNTGKLETKYDLTRWYERYQSLGGFPVLFFRKL